MIVVEEEGVLPAYVGVCRRCGARLSAQRLDLVARKSRLHCDCPQCGNAVAMRPAVQYLATDLV